MARARRKVKIKRWPARPKPKRLGRGKGLRFPSKLTQGTSSGDGNGGDGGGS